MPSLANFFEVCLKNNDFLFGKHRFLSGLFLYLSRGKRIIFTRDIMNKKLLELLQDKCKDFGLTKKAIEDIAEIISEGVSDEASDEELEEKANSAVPYARLMQAEVTRKAQKQDAKKKSTNNSDGDDGVSKKADDDQPEWFKKFKAETDKKLTALEAENESLKAEKQKAERSANITATAKRLGIPDFLMKRFAIADDADIEKELTEYKQDLITSRLMPSTEASITSSSEQAAKDDAEAWAKKLPDL